jgi:hypothetical protein
MKKKAGIGRYRRGEVLLNIKSVSPGQLLILDNIKYKSTDLIKVTQTFKDKFYAVFVDPENPRELKSKGDEEFVVYPTDLEKGEYYIALEPSPKEAEPEVEDVETGVTEPVDNDQDVEMSVEKTVETPEQDVSVEKTVEKEDKAASKKTVSRDLPDNILDSYLETALWSSHNMDKEEEFFDEKYSIEDFAPEAITQAKKDTSTFLKKAKEIVLNIDPEYELDESYAGHDFWLTRNSHGAGFWDGDYPKEIGESLTELSDRFGETYIIVGDDDKLYFEGGNNVEASIKEDIQSPVRDQKDYGEEPVSAKNKQKESADVRQKDSVDSSLPNAYVYSGETVNVVLGPEGTEYTGVLEQNEDGTYAVFETNESFVDGEKPISRTFTYNDIVDITPKKDASKKEAVNDLSDEAEDIGEDEFVEEIERDIQEYKESGVSKETLIGSLLPILTEDISEEWGSDLMVSMSDSGDTIEGKQPVLEISTGRKSYVLTTDGSLYTVSKTSEETGDETFTGDEYIKEIEIHYNDPVLMDSVDNIKELYTLSIDDITGQKLESAAAELVQAVTDTIENEKRAVKKTSEGVGVGDGGGGDEPGVTESPDYDVMVQTPFSRYTDNSKIADYDENEDGGEDEEDDDYQATNEFVSVELTDDELVEPSDEDIIINEDTGWRNQNNYTAQYGGKTIAEANDIDELADDVKQWMEKNKFWPSIYGINERGNIIPYAIQKIGAVDNFEMDPIYNNKENLFGSHVSTIKNIFANTEVFTSPVGDLGDDGSAYDILEEDRNFTGVNEELASLTVNEYLNGKATSLASFEDFCNHIKDFYGIDKESSSKVVDAWYDDSEVDLVSFIKENAKKDLLK